MKKIMDFKNINFNSIEEQQKARNQLKQDLVLRINNNMPISKLGKKALVDRVNILL